MPNLYHRHSGNTSATSSTYTLNSHTNSPYDLSGKNPTPAAVVLTSESMPKHSNCTYGSLEATHSTQQAAHRRPRRRSRYQRYPDPSTSSSFRAGNPARGPRPLIRGSSKVLLRLPAPLMPREQPGCQRTFVWQFLPVAATLSVCAKLAIILSRW